MGNWLIKGKICLAVLATTLAVAGYSQNSTSTLVFDTYEWDFGTLREVDGKVSHTFIFSNYGKTPVVIERIKVDCGCTAVNYSREPVLPGSRGTIEVVFDPDRYSGRFSKSVTVYSDGGRNRNLLTVKGNVIGRPLTVEEEYPFALPQELRAESLHRALGYIWNGGSKSVAVGIINTSLSEAVISARIEGSGRLAAVVPPTIGGGERVLLTFTYDLSGDTPIYGVLADRVYLTVNGKESELPITLNAIAVDDFGEVDPARAPRCEVTPAYHNFGDVAPGSEVSYSATIANKGKTDLAVRSVSVRRNTVCDLHEGVIIPPGKNMEVKLTMKVGPEAYGTQIGGISFVVNDPERPFREIRLGAEAY